MLYVIRITGDNKGGFRLANSKPCQHCINKLKSLGIKKIAYSVTDGVVVEKVSEITNRPSSGNRTLFGI
jgi:hypothetical protein